MRSFQCLCLVLLGCSDVEAPATTPRVDAPVERGAFDAGAQDIANGGAAGATSTQPSSNPSESTMPGTLLGGAGAAAASPTRPGTLDAGSDAAPDAVDACADEASLTVMTFNIRFDSGTGTGVDAWNAPTNPRRERVRTTIRNADPDLLGVQEALSNQVDDLSRDLADYEFWGVGRDDGVRAGEYAGIFYRSARFRRVRSGHFWLSLTPDVPGTVFAGSGSIRMASWVALADARSQRELFFIDTHWDNASQASREQSAALIRRQVATLAAGLPIILTGDLNQSEDNAAVATLLAPEPVDTPQLIDGYRTVHPDVDPNERTFHDFTGATAGSRIDYVLHDRAFDMQAASIDRTAFAQRWASDHFAVIGTLGWASDGSGNACP